MSIHLRRANGDTADERIRRSNERRHELILAALRIVAREGTSAVTHLAVTAEANLGHGAVVHHFGSRDALLREAMEYLMARNFALFEEYWTKVEQHAHDPVEFADQLCALVVALLADDRDLAVATFEFQLAATREPELRVVLADCGRGFGPRTMSALEALGSTDPEGDMVMLIHAIGGLLAGQLALPRPDFEYRVLRPTVQRLARAIASSRRPARSQLPPKPRPAAN